MNYVGDIPPKPNALDRIFGVAKPIIGVVHLDPLPGSPRYEGKDVQAIYENGARDARVLADGGVDGIIIENAFDLPYARPEDIGFETVASLTAACLAAQRAGLPLGIMCVANGIVPAIAVGKAVGARWVRANQWTHAYVAAEGLINSPAGRALRYRSNLRAAGEIAVFADVHVKFGAHAITADRSIEDQARDAEFLDADALIVTGTRTGVAPTVKDVGLVKESSRLPVIIGSGLDSTTADELLSVADGAIVGSWLKEEGYWWNPVDADRVHTLMEAVRSLRKGLEEAEDDERIQT
jgi:uncharacterized protein